MTPIGPYSHIAKVGEFITIGGTAGVDPATGELAGPDVASQTKQILAAFEIMLASVGSGTTAKVAPPQGVNTSELLENSIGIC